MGVHLQCRRSQFDSDIAYVKTREMDLLLVDDATVKVGIGVKNMTDNYVFKLSDMKVYNISIPCIKGKYLTDYRSASYRSTRNNHNSFSIECILADDSFFEESKMDNSIVFYETEKFDEEIAPNLSRKVYWNNGFICINKQLENDGTFSVEFYRERVGVENNTIYSKIFLTGVGECKFTTGKRYSVVY